MASLLDDLKAQSVHKPAAKPAAASGGRTSSQPGADNSGMSDSAAAAAASSGAIGPLTATAQQLADVVSNMEGGIAMDNNVIPVLKARHLSSAMVCCDVLAVYLCPRAL